MSVPALAAALKDEGYGGVICTVAREGYEFQRKMVSGVEVMAPAGVSKNPLYYHHDFYRLITNIAAKLSVDIVHAHSVWTYPTFCSARLARVFDVPFFLTPRSSLYQVSMRKSFVKKKLVRWGYLDRLLNAGAYVHATESREMHEVMEQWPGASVFCAQNGVNAIHIGGRSKVNDRRAFGIEASTRVFLFLGRVHPRKNIELTIRAFAQLIRGGENAVLLVAGAFSSSSYERVVRRLVAELDIVNQVVFAGHVSGDLKCAAYSAADVFILVSKFENFGVSVAEALSAGLPVIVSNNMPWGAVDKKGCGVTVSVARTDEVFSAMRVYLRSTDQQLELMGRLGIDLSKKYTWEAQASVVASHYKSSLRALQRG